jgi:hypothetical protein
MVNRLDPFEQQMFLTDITKVNWPLFYMNTAYGIKKFVLKEEAELPSMGQNNAITFINSSNQTVFEFLNSSANMKIRSVDEVTTIILSS